MATCTLANGVADTGATPNTSGAFTPASGDLLVVLVAAAATAENPGTLTSSISGFTFTQFQFQARSAGSHSVYGFVSNALVSDTSSQTVTFDTPADPSTGTVIFVYRVSGITLTGLSAVLQTDGSNGAAATTPSNVFAANVNTNNPTLGIVANLSNPAGMTPPTGWTEHATQGDLGHATPTHGGEAVHRDSGFTGTTITWGSTSATAWGSIAVEIDTSAAPSVQPVQRNTRGFPAVALGFFAEQEYVLPKHYLYTRQAAAAAQNPQMLQRLTRAAPWTQEIEEYAIPKHYLYTREAPVVVQTPQMLQRLARAVAPFIELEEYRQPVYSWIWRNPPAQQFQPLQRFQSIRFYVDEVEQPLQALQRWLPRSAPPAAATYQPLMFFYRPKLSEPPVEERLIPSDYSELMFDRFVDTTPPVVGDEEWIIRLRRRHRR